MSQCTICQKSFPQQRSLQQHLRDKHVKNNDDTRVTNTPTTKPKTRHPSDLANTIECEPCGRSFVSQPALDQHLRDAPIHSAVRCEPCGKRFLSQSALDQHFQDAPVHSAVRCAPCGRSFSNQSALDQHLRDAPVHSAKTSTPLDVFFRSFPSFIYDPFLSPSDSYDHLRKQQRWTYDDPQSDEAWARYQDAMKAELELWFGAEDDLLAWQTLCRAVDIKPLPQTCSSCETAVRQRFVNIIDLIEWKRNNEAPVRKPQLFSSLEELRGYTKESRKVFPADDLRDDEKGGNVVLRHLLRRLFKQGSKRVFRKRF